MKFNKGEIIIFDAKPSFLKKNTIHLYGAQGVIIKSYNLKIGDSFRVVDFMSNKMILKPVSAKIDNDYWFYQFSINDKSFKKI